MLDLKKINQIRNLDEAKYDRPYQDSRTRLRHLAKINTIKPVHPEKEDPLENIPHTPKTDKEKRIKAALDKMGQQFKEGSVNYHTTIAQTAKGLSTKHKHSALAMKSKFKFKPPALGNNMVVSAKESVEIEESKIDRVKAMLKKAQSSEQKKLDKQNQKDLKRLNTEEVEPIEEISKELAKSYLDKTVDPVYGMPKHGMQNRIKGIRQASIRVLKKAGKPKTN